jgi:serine/threonine protein kinase
MTPIEPRLATALSSDYRLERELGQGGMGTVHLAHDLGHERDVAITVLHPDLGATRPWLRSGEMETFPGRKGSAAIHEIHVAQRALRAMRFAPAGSSTKR